MLLKAMVRWPMKSWPMGSWSHTRKRTKARSGMWTVNTRVSSHMGLNPAGGSKHKQRQRSKSVQDKTQKNYDLTIIIYHSGLALTAVHWQANNLHLHERVNDLTQRRRKRERTAELRTLKGPTDISAIFGFEGKCVHKCLFFFWKKTKNFF